MATSEMEELVLLEDDADHYEDYRYEDYEVYEDYSDVEGDRDRQETSAKLTDATTRDGKKADGHGVEEQSILINEQDESEEHRLNEDTEEVEGSGESNEGHSNDCTVDEELDVLLL